MKVRLNGEEKASVADLPTDQNSKENDFDIDNIFEEVTLNEKILQRDSKPVLKSESETIACPKTPISCGKDVLRIEEFESQFE